MGLGGVLPWLTRVLGEREVRSWIGKFAFDEEVRSCIAQSGWKMEAFRRATSQRCVVAAIHATCGYIETFTMLELNVIESIVLHKSKVS